VLPIATLATIEEREREEEMRKCGGKGRRRGRKRYRVVRTEGERRER